MSCESSQYNANLRWLWLLGCICFASVAMQQCAIEPLSLVGFPCKQDSDCTTGGNYHCAANGTCQSGTAPTAPDATGAQTEHPDEPTTPDERSTPPKDTTEPQREAGVDRGQRETPSLDAQFQETQPDTPDFACQDGQTRSCYTGPPKTKDIGACRGGEQRCVGGKWERTCRGQRLPQTSRCPHFQDEDCDGKPDASKPCSWLLTSVSSSQSSVEMWATPRLHYDPQGHIIIGGRSNGTLQLGSLQFQSTDHEGFVAKIDRQGNPLWRTTFGSKSKTTLPYQDQVQALAIGPNGSVFAGGNVPGPITLAGKTHPYRSGTIDGYVANLDPQGQVNWGFVITGNSHQSVGNIAHDGNKHIYISGYGSKQTTLEATYPNPGNSHSFTATRAPDPSRPDAFIAKYTELGSLVWLRRFVSVAWLRTWSGNGLQTASDGSLYGIILHSIDESETLLYSSPLTEVYKGKESGWHMQLFQLDAAGKFQRLSGTKYIAHKHPNRAKAESHLLLPSPQGPDKEVYVYGGYIGQSRLFHGTDTVSSEGTKYTDAFVVRLHSTPKGFARQWLAEVKSSGYDHVHQMRQRKNAAGIATELLLCGSVHGDARFTSAATNIPIVVKGVGTPVGFVARLRASDGAWLEVKTLPASLGSSCSAVALTPSGALHVLGDFSGTLTLPDKQQHNAQDAGRHLFVWRTTLSTLFPTPMP